MTSDLKFPFGATFLRALAYFVVAVVLILVWGFFTGQTISADENEGLEIAQFVALIITAIIAALAFMHTDKKLLKVASLVLVCIALAALIRETQSCSSNFANGFCLPKIINRILMVLVVVAAIAGTVIYAEAIKENFASLITPATLWPAFAIVALMLLSQLFENLDGSNKSVLGIEHGFVYLEEFSELLGAVLSTSLAVHFYKKAKGMVVLK